MATLSLLPRLLLFSISLFVLVARADPDTHTTCAPSIANNDTFIWWNNRKGSNPCEVLQALLRQCDPAHIIHELPDSPVSGPDICTAPQDTSDTARVSPCCCNTPAYALRQACWSCQHGQTNPSLPHRRPTFREYLQCPESARNGYQIFKAAKVPKWAFLPIEIDAPWSFDLAMFAYRTNYQFFMMNMNMMPKDDDDDDDDDHGHSKGDNHGDKGNSSSQQAVKQSGTSSGTPSSGMSKSMMAVAIAGGVLAGLAAVACALAIAICLQRRRQKRKDMAAGNIPPAWYVRGNYVPTHLAASQSTLDLEIPPAAIVVTRSSPTIGSAASRRPASWTSSLAREPTMVRSSEGTVAQSTVYGYGAVKPQRMSSTDTHSFSI